MTDLAQALARAVREDGLRDLSVQVSRYGADGVTPAAWQAIAKYEGRLKGPWGVGVRGSHSAALLAALEEGARLVPKPVKNEEDIFS